MVTARTPRIEVSRLGECVGRRGVRRGGRLERLPAGELRVQDVAAGGPSGGSVVVGDDGGDDPDGRGRDEERDDEPADGPKRGPGVVRETSPGDEDGRSPRVARQHAGDQHRDPGSGDDEPDHDEQEAGAVGEDLGAGGGGPATDEEGELGQTHQQRDQPPGAWGGGRDSAGHAERGDLHPPQGEAGGDDGRDRDTDRDDQGVGQAQREVARKERLAGERHPRERRPQQEEQAEATDHATRGGDAGFRGGDDRHLARSGADEAHGGEALLPSRGRQAGGRADEDEHRQQQGAGDHREDELDPIGVRVPGRALRSRLDASDLVRARCLRELRDGVADDDDERVRRGERRRPDDAHLVTGVAVAQLGGGGGAQESGQGRGGVELPGVGEAGDPGRNR